MRNVTVNVADLIADLKKNREQHRDLFLRAQKGFRKQMIDELDRALEDARRGKKIRRFFELPEPIDKTEEYDVAISMLEAHVEDTIEISAHEYRCFVLDKWDWAEHALVTNTRYST